MKKNHCSFDGDREDVLTGYVYGELDPRDRSVFDTHVATCAVCREELADLRDVRGLLGRWAAPATDRLVHTDGLVQTPVTPLRPRRRWQDLPAWAEAAAAVLIVGVAAGAANLDVRYGKDGLSVHTGWMRPTDSRVETPAAAQAATAPPWRSDLTALEQRLRADMQTVAAPARTAVSKPSVSSEDLKEVRAFVAESERKQQRELALRIAEVMHDVQTERQADLVKIERTLGTIQNNTGVEVMRQRQLLNSLAVRVSQRQ